MCCQLRVRACPVGKGLNVWHALDDVQEHDLQEATIQEYGAF